MPKIIMHIDLNAFFATAEELKDPSLVGKPLAVGGIGRRGVISTASYEARKYGVHSAMPTYKAFEKCPNLILKEPDFRFYEMLSISFVSYIRKFSSIIEKASIDECYVDMTNALIDIEDKYSYLKSLQQGLLDEIGLKCSIGLAATKFLAKMASDMKKPMGITIIRKEDIKDKIYPLPIEDFYGIGKKTSPKLRNMGIKTIGDLASVIDSDDESMAKIFGKTYSWVKESVNGEGNDVVDIEPWDPKSVGHSETFTFDTDDEEIIKNKIIELSKRVSIDAKTEKKVGKTIQIQIRDTEFKNHNKSLTMGEYTNDPNKISEVAIKLFERNFIGMEIRLVGVTLQNLINPKKMPVQLSLLEDTPTDEDDITRNIVNDINRKMKKKVVRLGSEAKDE